MRGKTLNQKRFGEGFRDGPLVHKRAPWPGCAAESSWGHPCQGKVWGSTEIYVDEAPPGPGWYERLLRDLEKEHPRMWVRVRFCEPHAREVIMRTEDYLDEPDLWAPMTSSPPILPRPWTFKPKKVSKLLLPGDTDE